MLSNIVHLVSTVDKINFGIWNAAVFGANYLSQQKSIKTFLVVCSDTVSNKPVLENVTIIFKGDSNIDALLTDHGLSFKNTIIVSHGCWQQPTRLAFGLKKKNYRWIYVPHGMLEPWSFSQGKLKKKLYFHLFEKRWANASDVIRAVSRNEKDNLTGLFHRAVDLIENGVAIPAASKKDSTTQIFLFMSRLHHKKGIVPLVKAWKSAYGEIANKKLMIAGPDEGEYENIKDLISGNMEYVGAVYGNAKMQLLNQAHYFVLHLSAKGSQPVCSKQ